MKNREEEFLRLKNEYLSHRPPEQQLLLMQQAMAKAKADKKKAVRRRRIRNFATAAAAAAAMLIMPNTSASVANAMEQIPLIGGVIKVITVRDYQKKDDKKDVDIKEPKLTADNSSAETEATGTSETEEDAGKTKNKNSSDGVNDKSSGKKKKSENGGVTASEEKTEQSTAGYNYPVPEERVKEIPVPSEDSVKIADAEQTQEGKPADASEAAKNNVAAKPQTQTPAKDETAGSQPKETDAEEEVAAPTTALTSALDETNQQVENFIQTLLAEYEDDMESSGYLSFTTDYEIVTDTDGWFTLAVYATIAEGDGFTLERYYHIDKTTEKVAGLSDLFPEGADYVGAISANIKEQIAKQMEEDENKVFFTEEEAKELDGISAFTSIKPDQNFYLDENGAIIIVFDEGEIAPASMGSPHFTIPATVTAALDMDKTTTMKNATEKEEEDTEADEIETEKEDNGITEEMDEPDLGKIPKKSGGEDQNQIAEPEESDNIPAEAKAPTEEEVSGKAAEETKAVSEETIDGERDYEEVGEVEETGKMTE